MAGQVELKGAVMSRQRRVYFIPAGVFVNTAGESKAVVIVNRKDHLLPAAWSEGIDTILFFGGGVEASDAGNDILALEREIKEEIGDWYETAAYPATSKGSFGVNAEGSSGFVKICTSNEAFGFYTRLMDVGPSSKDLLMKSCKEGLVSFLTIDTFLKYKDIPALWAMPQVRDTVGEAFHMMKAWNPNIK
jgi:hypothetical protein